MTEEQRLFRLTLLNITSGELFSNPLTCLTQLSSPSNDEYTFKSISFVGSSLLFSGSTVPSAASLSPFRARSRTGTPLGRSLFALYRTSCKLRSELSTKCWRPWSSNTSRCNAFSSADDDPNRFEGYGEKNRKAQTTQANKNQIVLLLLNAGEEVTGLGRPDFCLGDIGGK